MIAFAVIVRSELRGLPVDEALKQLMTDSSSARVEPIDGRLGQVERERDRFVAAIDTSE